MPEHKIDIEDARKNPALCGAYIAETIGNAESKVAATSVFIDYLLGMNEVDKAAEYADSIADPFSRDKLLIRVAERCVKIGDDDYAEQLADAVEDPSIRGLAKNAIVEAFSKEGKFESAIRIANEVPDPSEAFAGIAADLVLEGRIDEAKELINDIDFYKARVNGRIGSVFAMIEKGETEQAAAWLKTAASESDEIEFPVDKYRAFIELGSAYLSLEEGDKAAEFFARSASLADELDPQNRDTILVNAATGLMEAGDVERADEILDRVVDKTQIANCLYGFSRAYEKDGEAEDALETIEEAYAMLKSQTEYEIRDTKAKWVSHANIAIQFQRSGATDRAVEIAHENLVEEQKNRALVSIAQLLVMDGRIEEADDVIKGVQPDSELVESYVSLSDAAYTRFEKLAEDSVESSAPKDSEETSDLGSSYEVSGTVTQGYSVEERPEGLLAVSDSLQVDYLLRAADSLDDIDQQNVRCVVSDEICRRLNSYGEKDTAIELARQNLARATELKSEGDRAIALMSIASVYNLLNIETNESDQGILYTVARKATW